MKIKCINEGSGTLIQKDQIYEVDHEDAHYYYIVMMPNFPMGACFTKDRFQICQEEETLPALNASHALPRYVKCIDDRGSSELQVDQIYEVSGEKSSKSDWLLVGCKMSWNKRRFEIVIQNTAAH